MKGLELLAEGRWRYGVAAILFVVGSGGFLIGRTAESAPMSAGLAAGLFSTACILLASILVAPPFARFICYKIGTMFFSDDRFDKPQPIYSIPEARRREGNYEEAIAGFEKIAAEDPQEVRAYIGMIDVAIVELKDIPRAEAMMREALSVLSQPADRERLLTCVHNSRSMLQNKRDGVPDRPPLPLEPRRRPSDPTRAGGRT